MLEPCTQPQCEKAGGQREGTLSHTYDRHKTDRVAWLGERLLLASAFACPRGQP